MQSCSAAKQLVAGCVSHQSGRAWTETKAEGSPFLLNVHMVFLLVEGMRLSGYTGYSMGDADEVKDLVG